MQVNMSLLPWLQCVFIATLTIWFTLLDRCMYISLTAFISLPAGLREVQAAGIKFTHRATPYTADGHVGPLGCAKFHLNRCTGGGGMRPLKYQKFPLFGVYSPHVGKPLDQFQNSSGHLCALLSCRSVSNLTWFNCFTGYGVITEKTARLSFRPDFSVHP